MIRKIVIGGGILLSVLVVRRSQTAYNEDYLLDAILLSNLGTLLLLVITYIDMVWRFQDIEQRETIRRSSQ